jgi:hypothetical protein
MKITNIEWDIDEEDIETNKGELRDELEEYLNGLRICDYITRSEQSDILNDFDTWAETAKIGDTYFYDCNEYTLKEDEDTKLPTELDVPEELIKKGCSADEIVDWASDEYGFCIRNCWIG